MSLSALPENFRQQNILQKYTQKVLVINAYNIDLKL